MTWFGAHKNGRTVLTSTSARLVADTEAFLVGGYADELRRRHEQVPGWARLNTLAHADLNAVRLTRRSLAATKAAALADWHEETWRRAERALAFELLELVKNDPETLARIQRRVLVPLELELIRSEAASGLSVAQFLDSTRTALRSNIT